VEVVVAQFLTYYPGICLEGPESGPPTPIINEVYRHTLCMTFPLCLHFVHPVPVTGILTSPTLKM